MSHTAMSRTTLTATALVLALGLTACGGDGGEQVGADKKQTLTVWAMGEEGNRVAEIAKTFSKEHPEITVKVTPIGWDVAHQKLVSAAAAGQLPDMAQLGSTWMGEFIELDALEPIDTEAFEEKDFFPAAWQGNEKDGEVYGVPWYVDTRVLYYRTDLAKKAGVRGEPKTWADQLKLAEGYKKLDSTKWAFALPAGGNGAWQNWLPYLFQAGGALTDKDGKPTLDSPESVKALTEYAKYFDKDLARTTPFAPGYDVIKDFGADKVPMFASGPWMVQNIKDQAPKIVDKYETVPLPADVAQGNIIGGASLVTFAGSKHKAGAQEFTKFLTSAKTQAKWYEMAKSLPANRQAWNEPQLKSADLGDYKAALEAAKPVPALANWEEVAHQIDITLEKLGKGDDPAELAAKLQKNAESLVS